MAIAIAAQAHRDTQAIARANSVFSITMPIARVLQGKLGFLQMTGKCRVKTVSASSLYPLKILPLYFKNCHATTGTWKTTYCFT